MCPDNWLFWENDLYKNYVGRVFLQYESLGDEIKYITEKRPWYKNDIVMGFLQYESLGDEIKGNHDGLILSLGLDESSSHLLRVG